MINSQDKENAIFEEKVKRKNVRWKKSKDPAAHEACIFDYNKEPLEVARITKSNTDSNAYYYCSDFLGVELEELASESLELAKEEIENMVCEHIEEQIDHWSDMWRAFELCE
ncbi:hypothetical protein M2146_002545 [Lachnospiraceae bacterium PF1-22]